MPSKFNIQLLCRELLLIRLIPNIDETFLGRNKLVNDIWP